MWLLTTVISRPPIPVAVPEATTQACNFQAGPGPRATPLLNQSPTRAYLIIFLTRRPGSLASRKVLSGAGLLLGTPGAPLCLCLAP